MKHLNHIGLLMGLPILLSGCSLFGGNDTIGSLKSQETEESNLDFSDMNHHQVREEYQELKG